MRNLQKVCIQLATCEEDRPHFQRFLRCVESSGLPFAVHLDRFDGAGLVGHPQCVGHTSKASGEFEEWDKQGVLDLIVGLGYSWSLALDVDETIPQATAARLDPYLRGKTGLVSLRYLNFWGDERHVRTDGPFAATRRKKLYCLMNRRWKYLSKVINGPYPNRAVAEYDSDLTCHHYGFMTAESRKAHKDRWDRIYGAAAGKNPYGLWDYVTNEVDHPATVLETDAAD